jgi:predicted cupin superfamily sugar epimerase
VGRFEMANHDGVLETARDLIRRLELEAHPEGGWFRETHRSPVSLPREALPPGYPGDRPAATSILFLVEGGHATARHRLRSGEIWLHHAGDPLFLRIEPEDGEIEEVVLGPGEGQRFQAVVPPGGWQSARVPAGPHGYALAACVVAPGFVYEDFEVDG